MRPLSFVLCALVVLAGASPARAFVPPTWHDNAPQRAVMGKWALVSVGGSTAKEVLGVAVITLEIDRARIVTRMDTQTKVATYEATVDEDGILSLHVTDEATGAKRWTADVLLESSTEMTLYYRDEGSEDDVGTALHFERTE